MTPNVERPPNSPTNGFVAFAGDSAAKSGAGCTEFSAGTGAGSGRAWEFVKRCDCFPLNSVLKYTSWDDREPAMSIRSTITAQVIEIAKRQKKALAPLTDDLPLLESGLDSLCLAVLVASLEDHLDLDPFADEGVGGFPVTFGDFVKLYENAAA